MKFIPTTVADLEKLKARAKVLKRKHAIKHRLALDRAAQEAKYQHWHHATLCQRQSNDDALGGSLLFFCESITKDALKGETHYIQLPHHPIVFVADGRRNAYALNADSDEATVLALDGEEEPYAATVDAIQWQARYEFTGNSVVLSLASGKRLELAVDSERLSEALEMAQGNGVTDLQIHDPDSAESQDLFAHIFGGVGLEPISAEAVQMLLAKGYDQAAIDQAISEGASFSRPRVSLVYPIMSSDDIED
ncbi:hypothetical protein [Variovorax sp.]|jgi:hypothetical protein|uniref:hypothetical protein n=1 Tax=Variovorax sp. TaxID=1871043 RepID=UPI001ACD989A|nr:hypothetical protein [Burkholderiales bacterium]